MPRIKIVPSETLNCASRLDSNLSQLNDVSSQIASASSRLNWSVKSKSNIDSSMQNALSTSKNLSSELSSLSSYIKNATNRLVEADKSGEKGILDRIKKYNKIQANIYQEAYVNKIAHKEPVIKNPGDYYFEDVDGKNIDKVYYLNDENAVFSQGHAAILLVKSDGSGIYYSYGTNEKLLNGDINKIINGPQIIAGKNYPGVINRRDLSPNDIDQFKFDGKIGTNQYTRYLSIDVDEKQGNKMFSEAQKIFNNEDKVYNLYNSNCNHKTQEILSAGNINFTLDKGLENVQNPNAFLYNARGALWERLSPNPESDKFGTIPNEAFEAGVSQWEVYKGYEAGSFKNITASNTNSLDLGPTDEANGSAKLK